MNFKPIIFAMLAVGSMATHAQINSQQSGGYAERAALMLGDGNFQGCIDQSDVALKLGDPNREHLLWLSATAAFKGGLPEARAKVSAFVRQFPASSNIHQARLMLATLTFYGGDYAQALKELRAIDANALPLAQAEDLDYRTAFCLLKLGQNAEALPIFEKLLATKAYGSAAKFYEGYIAYSDGDYDRALQLFAQCNAATDPGNMADYYVAQILFKRAQYADAANLVMKLLPRKDIPEEFIDEAERLAGECFYELGDDNRAMAYLNPYIAKHLDQAPLSTRYIVGSERYQMGDYDDAISLLTPVGDLHDAMGQSATLTIGQSYLAKGNNKAAIMAFDKAVQLNADPKITELAYYNYAVAQVDGGRVPFGSSVKTLESFIYRYPNSRYANTVREYLVKGYMSSDDYAGALRWLNSIQGKPTDQMLDARQQVCFMLGARAVQAGNANEAVNYLLEAEKYAGRNADIARQTRFWLGDAYYAQGQYAKAQKQYQAFLREAPNADANRPMAQYNLAYALFAQRQYDEARKQFQVTNSLKALPAEAKTDALNRIADTHYYQSDFAQAEKAYDQAYKASPATGDYPLYQFALMRGINGNQQGKYLTLKEMLELFPTSPLRPNALMQLALAQTVLNKKDEAIATYQTVVKEHPTTTQGRNALLQLAILNRNDGNADKAMEYYKLLISLYPTSSEASVAMQDLKHIYATSGDIAELDAFLQSVEGAPQLSEPERIAIDSAALLRKALDDKLPARQRLTAALSYLEKYPDAEGADAAMKAAADIEFGQGDADKALEHYTTLEQKASTATMRHDARMGILRTARDMGQNDLVIATAQQILASTSANGRDLPEVKFIRAGALAETNRTADAIAIWKELAKNPENVYGTRAAYELTDHYFAAKNYDEAMNTAEALIDANPPHPYWLARTYILYSDILRAQGPDYEYEADQYLRALRENYPGNDTDIFMMIDKRLPKK